MLKRFQMVLVRRKGDSGDWTPGRVELISPNGVSVAISLDGVVRAGRGFIATVLPLLYDEARGSYRCILGSEEEYEVEAVPGG